jgi:hypothetical protein
MRAIASIPKDRDTTTLLYPSIVWTRIRSIGYSLFTIKISDGTKRYALNLSSKEVI